jgi:Arginase family.
MDLGQTRRGVDMGPSAIRYAGLLPRLEQLGYDVLDEGNIEIEQRNTTVDPLNGIRNLEAVVKANIKLAEKIRKIKEKGNFPLILGGDHSLAIGSLAGIAPFHHHLGVIWYDAHGDLNTAETSPSGNIHGMPLAASLGFGVPELTELGGFSPKIRPENVVLIGIRSLDDGEKRLIQKKISRYIRCRKWTGWGCQR